MQDIISEKTLIPVSLIIVLVGAIFWLSSMYALANNNKEQIVEIKNDYKQGIDRLEKKIDILLLRSK